MPLLTNDASVFGLMMAMLALIFYTYQSANPRYVTFYRYCPAILLCYFLPSLLNTFNIVDPSQSNIYYVASRYLLPAAITLLTLSIDLKAIMSLGPKLIIMFLVGTLGIVIGGPIALLIMGSFFPDMLNGAGMESVWRGMTTVAGSWIGGGANQTAMKEIYEVGDNIFSAMITVDVLVANAWMAVLLLIASRANQMDQLFGADSQAVTDLRKQVELAAKKYDKTPQLPDLIVKLGVAFFVVALGHIIADIIAPYMTEHYPEAKRYSLHSHFFWMIVTVTTIGICLSFTSVRKLEHTGASKVGQVFIYILVAAIGLNMNIAAIADSPVYFVLGSIWILIHATLLLLAAWLIKAPMFYLAVGSQANVGGAASAPVVAAAFHPALAPVGVLLAVFGYAVGTYMAWFCGQILHSISY